MYALTLRAGKPGVRSRLAREVARLFQSSDAPLGADGERALARRRSLRIEPLESRQMMAAAALASQIAPLWFQNLDTGATADHAGTATWTTEGTIVASAESNSSAQTLGENVYDWIVQFDTASLGGISCVAETAGLLAESGIEFEAVRGLGLAGMVLVRSSGASLDTVAGWLSTDTDVAGFEEDACRAADATSTSVSTSSKQWDLAAIDAQQAWSLTGGSSSVVVAVIDTGVDYNHVDLAANIWTNVYAGQDGFTGDLHGYNFVGNNGDPMDDNGHGTHVAGTIAAEANGYGVTGVAYATTIMPLKFLDSNGAGYLSDAVAAMNYATMMRSRYGVNVRVANCSWGGSGFSAALENAIQAANNAGILVVVAAGNSGTNNDVLPQYPANYNAPNVISVAASTQTNQLASFSNYGATTVDLAAPGMSIYSTTPNNTYSTMSGTSMAAPHVSAVAALAWALNPSATVAQVRSAMLQGVDSVASLSGKLVSGGVLDAYNTLKLVGTATKQPPVVGSLTVSASSVTAGATVTLAAHGVTGPSARVASVSFVLDTNNDGQYGAADRVLGVSTTLTGSDASVALNTAGYSAGTYRILARAQDANGTYSACVATTLTVLPSDDYGNNAATAALVGTSSSTAGTINSGSDTDWFKFQATAGKTYTLTVGLGTLRDSVLYLYDTNGKKQLAFNDDYGRKLSSQITWTAKTSGTYYLSVGGYGNRYTGDYTLAIKGPGGSTSTAAGAANLAARSFDASPLLAVSQDAVATSADMAAYNAKPASQWTAFSGGDWLAHAASAGDSLSAVAPRVAANMPIHDAVFSRFASPDEHSPLSGTRTLALELPPLHLMDGRLSDAQTTNDHRAIDAVFDSFGAALFSLTDEW